MDPLQQDVETFYVSITKKPLQEMSPIDFETSVINQLTTRKNDIKACMQNLEEQEKKVEEMISQHENSLKQLEQLEQQSEEETLLLAKASFRVV